MKHRDLRKGIQEIWKYLAFNSHCSVRNLILGHKDPYSLTAFYENVLIAPSKDRRRGEMKCCWH